MKRKCLCCDAAGGLTARMDRTQAAQLYAGNIEYGYFVREMEARCQAAGLSQFMDADQLIAMAGSLSEEQLKYASTLVQALWSSSQTRCPFDLHVNQHCV